MKKCFPIIFIISILVLLMQLLVNFLISEKTANYTLVVDEKKEYLINESLSVDDGVSYYDFLVKDVSDRVYSFSVSRDFNKQTEVVKDIKEYSQGNVTCIFPVFKRDEYGHLSCIRDGKQISYSALKQSGDTNISSIVENLKEFGYSNPEWTDYSTDTTRLEVGTRGIDYYKKNLLDDYVFLMWRYRGLYILNTNKPYISSFMSYDHYENDYSALVDNYYISADFKDNNKKVDELVSVNIANKARTLIILPAKTSESFYYNGVYDGKLYLTDPTVGKQYAVDPKKETAEVVGTTDTYFLMLKDGKLEEVDSKEFLKENQYFRDSVVVKEITDKYGSSTDIRKFRKFYYFKTSDGSVYKSHVDAPTDAVLLFKFEGLTEWKVRNGDIMAIVGDTMYFYSDDYGLLPIAKNSELTYNFKNIGDFWKEV